MDRMEKKAVSRVILASASPRRRDLLLQIGIEPEIIPSRVEEIITKSEPDQVVMELSRQKAEEVAARIGVMASEPERKRTTGSDAVVIGSDTVVSVEGRILGKPADRAEAYSMIQSLQGRSHSVYTGVTIIGGGRMKSFAVKTRVDVYPMSPAEIEAYLDRDEYGDKAGAYGIQGSFSAYIRGIEGSYTNVMGLPVGRLYQELRIGMIKLIVSDIDGTLVEDGGNRLNPELFDVIMRLKREKHIHFAAATGRQAASIEYTFRPIKKEIFYLAENGSYLGCLGRNLFLHPMDRETALSLVQDIRNTPELEVMVSGAKHAYIESRDPYFRDLMTKGYHYDLACVDDVTSVDDTIIKVAAHRREGNIQDAVTELRGRYSDRMKMTISGEQWMDCMALGVNKGEAVRTLQESLGIAPEETMAFGDQQNDIEMLNRAYHSFAVGNAREEVKKAARFQADRNHNDGVMKILKLLL